MPEFEQTSRNRVLRVANRGNYDKDAINAIVDEALICDVAFSVDGQPYIIPTIHPYVRGAQGVIHSSDWRISEPEHAYVSPAKLLAMTAIDLLYDDAGAARNIVADFTPKLTKESYLEFQRNLFGREHYRPEMA